MFRLSYKSVDGHLCRPTNARVGPAHGRHIETEEEDYFNADDDEDNDFVPTISSQRARGQAPASPMKALKRKRQAAALSNIMKVFRSPNLTPMRTSSLDLLADYNEDEDDLGETGIADDDLHSPLRSLLPSSQSKTLSKSTMSTKLSMPAGPRLTRRPTSPSSPPVRSSPDDDEDNLLESLVRSKHPRSSPTGTSSNLGMAPVRLNEKRRRDDDDDGLERLSRAKKPDLGFEKDEAKTSGRTGSTKIGDDPPKKIKLKFGAASLTMASSPVPSEPGAAKDGDTG